MIHGEAGNDVIEGGAGADQVWAGAGDDTVIASAGDGDDQYWGGDGIDTLDYAVASGEPDGRPRQRLHAARPGVWGTTGTDVVYGFENVITGSGHDTITATTAVNVMDGGLGNDTFRFTVGWRLPMATRSTAFQPGQTRSTVQRSTPTPGRAGVQHFTLAAGRSADGGRPGGGHPRGA